MDRVALARRFDELLASDPGDTYRALSRDHRSCGSAALLVDPADRFGDAPPVSTVDGTEVPINTDFNGFFLELAELRHVVVCRSSHSCPSLGPPPSSEIERSDSERTW
jgi:hypothetical protein